MTLQVRAVELMVFVDPLHARDLFEWIDLNLGPGVCADPLVPSVDEYYTALGRIARTATPSIPATRSSLGNCDFCL